MIRKKKKCEKCKRKISLSNYKRHFNSCDGTFFTGPNKPKATNSRKVFYDWKKIQKRYDTGLSWRELTEEFGVSMGALAAASKRGDLVSRNRSEATKLAIKKHGSPVMGKKAREKLSKRMSKENPGGKSKWYTVSGKKVQGRWERDFAKKCNELKVRWDRCNHILYTMNGKIKRYTPDFFLPDYNIFIEIKGYWWGNDKIKMKNVIEQNPEKHIFIMEKEDFYKFMEGELVWS